MLDEARITEQRAALCDAAGQAFYNSSKFTLRDLKSRGSQQQLPLETMTPAQRVARAKKACADAVVARKRSAKKTK